MSAITHTAPQECGFTLIEMMVVVSILALSMLVVPAITGGIAGSRLRAASDTLVAVLREVHTEAVRRDAPETLALNIPDRSFTTALRRGPQRLPRIISRLEVAPAALADAKGVIRIEFQADGSATPARIVLFNGERRMTVSVDWLTGRARQGE